MRTAVERDQRGFTLLEVLVAAVIAALAVGVLVRGTTGSVRSAQVSAHVMEATARARSHLAVLEQLPPVPGDGSGDDGGGYRWQTRVAQRERGGGYALFDLGAVISWDMDGGERRVELHSRRMAPAPVEAP